MALSREQQELVNRLNTAASSVAPRQQSGKDGQFFRDTARQLGAGLAEIPTILAGAADTVAGLAGADRPFSRAGSAVAQATGISPKAWGESLRESYSPALQRQQQRYEQDWDRAGELWEEGSRGRAVGRVVGGILTNPRAMTGMVAESVPASVVAGGAFGRAIRAAAPSVTPMTAGALGQAPIFAGFTMSQIDEEVDPQRAALASLGVGAGAAAIAKFGADLSYRLGLIDPHTAMAGGLAASVAPGTPVRSLGPRVGLGALAEGVLQDMPQEALEQMGKNWAEEKPLFQDVPRRSVDGLIAGMGMGAMFNVVRPPVAPTQQDGSATDLTRPQGEPQEGGPVMDWEQQTTPDLVQKYQQLSMMRTQFTDAQADLRAQAEQQIAQLEQTLAERGVTSEQLQTDDARRTYGALQQRAAFAEQQGQDSTIYRMRMRIMEDAFGEQLAQPDLVLLKKLKDQARPETDNLFRSDGQLKALPAREFQRLMSMPQETLNRYLLAQLEIAAADEAVGGRPSQFMPIYELLAEGLERPTSTPPVTQMDSADLTEQGTPYTDSAIAQAERSLDSQREFVRQIDEAYRAREEAAAQAREQAEREQLEARWADEGPMAEPLRPLQQQMQRQAEFEQAVQQREQQDEVRYDRDFSKALEQLRAQREQQEITDAEASLALRDELLRRRSMNTDAEAIIARRREEYQTLHPERRELAAFRKRLADMTDAQLELFSVEEIGLRQRAARAESRPRREPQVQPFQRTLPGVEPGPHRPGLVRPDMQRVETLKPYLEGLKSSLLSIERGGRVYADPVTGQKKRTPHAQPDWYRERPTDGHRAKSFIETIDMALADKGLSVKQRRMLDYLYEVAEGMAAEQQAYESEIQQQIAEAQAEAQAEREAIQAETETAPMVDDVPGFGEGIQTAPEGWDVAPAPAAEPAPAPAAEPVVAPEITGAVETQVPGMRIIRKKDGGYFAPKYAKSRATFLNNKFGELGFRYEAVQEGTQGWEVQETRVAPETTEVVPATEAAQVAEFDRLFAQLDIPADYNVDVLRANSLANAADADVEVSQIAEVAIDTARQYIDSRDMAENGGIIQPEVHDAVQERETTQVPVQPEAEASPEVVQEVRQQAPPVEAQRIVGDRLESTLEALSEYAERAAPEVQEYFDSLQEAIVNSDRASAVQSLSEIMEAAYEGPTGRVEGNVAGAGVLRNSIDAVRAYDSQIFSEAVLEVVNQRDIIPVTRTGKEDAAPTRFYRDILEAGVLPATAGKLTNIPKKNTSFDPAREFANKEHAPPGMTTTEAEAADISRGETVSLADYDKPGRFFIAEDGSELRNALPIGRVRAGVGTFLNKLHGVKPNVSIFTNQADLQHRNPELYERAVAADPSGRFATANAAGYVFGDGQILIFSDRIYTPRQLNTVLAHEILGHFGMRSFFGNVRFNNLMDKIWHEASELSVLRMAVEKIQAAHEGMTRQEAVEEYLSDRAAVLDASVIARVWDSFKRVLNAMGLRFGDETARALLHQSRRYVRNRNANATTSHLFTVEEMVDHMKSIEGMADPGMVGRFHTNENSVGHINHVTSQQLNNRVWDSSDYKQWFTAITDKGIKLSELGKRAWTEIRTMNYNARDNRGYKEFFRIMSSTVNKAVSLRTKYNTQMPILMNPAVEVAGKKMGDGITREQLERTGQMAIDSTLHFFSKLDDPGKIRTPDNSQPLVVMVDGELTPNFQVIEKMKQQARITPEQFQKGFTYTVEEVQPLSPQLKAEAEQRLAELETEIKALEDAGDKSSNTYKDKKRERNTLQDNLETGAHVVKVEREVAPRPDITADSIEYRAYVEAQNVMAEKAIDLLLANYAAAAGERVNVEQMISEAIQRPLTTDDKKFLKVVEDNYIALREEGMEYGDKGEVIHKPESLINSDKFIEYFNKALLSSTDNYFSKDVNAVEKYLRGMPFDDFVNEMRAFRERGEGLRFKEGARFIIQNKVANLALYEMYKNDAELLAKRTIMGNYIPLGREGRYQVRVQAVDGNGKEVAISQRQRSQLIYMQLDNKGEGQRTADEITKMFEESSKNKDGFFEVEIHREGRRVLENVRLVARLESARTKPAIHAEVNLNEVLTTLNRFNIQLTPQERKAVTVGLTQQNAKARTRLRREGTPGYDVKNWLKYVSQDLEAAASVIARRQHRHLLDQLLDTSLSSTNELWYGSQKTYDNLRAEYERLAADPNASEHAVAEARRRYTDYHYTYKVKDSQRTANEYLDRAQMDLSFLEAQTDVEWTDFGSGDVASRVRMFTTFAQLGGSAATAALNIIALSTNVMPFLASYNQKSNFGGGFGFANAVAAMHKAKGIGLPGKRAFAPFYEQLLEGYDAKNPNSTDPAHIAAQERLKKEGLTYDEAVFLHTQIQSGVMQAALYNAMLGSARGRITSGRAQRAMQSWMYMFSHSEQSARRITGLAAYRLARDRAIAANEAAGGKRSMKEIEAEAAEFAKSAINDTLGEYAMFNRPSIFRGDVRQFIFMYKMFPLTSLLLFTNMDKKGKLLMLGMLMMLSGAKGLPLGDDMMDILDTIAQRLGLGPRGVWKGSAEKTLVEFSNAAFGEQLTPIVMRGLVNNFMPANLSDRTSLGNLIPGTGIGLYGANQGREAMEIAGPIASFIGDTAGTALRLGEFAAGHAGIRPHTTTAMDVLRQSPFTMFRAAGDAMAYNQQGAIVNQRGQIVSEDMWWGTTAARLMGFYPSSAVRQYDVIRMMSRLDSFQKEIVAMHRQRWVAAKLRGDHETAREVVQQVRDWNETARGTEFEIHNFVPNSFRALQTARMTATERYRQSSPVAQRRHIDDMMELLGATE